MKYILSTILFFSLKGYTQIAIPSYSLSIGYQKTTNLLFPYGILKADIGSGDVIGHKDEKLANVLFIKANTKNFVPTNLSIYTSDGKFYSFNVAYKENPDTLNLSFMSQPIVQVPLNEAILDSDASIILTQPAFLHRKAREQDIRVKLTGIYSKEGRIWFKFNLKNLSELDYQTESIQFFIKDRHAAKRTAMQEIEKLPVWQSEEKLLFGFPRFTIDPSKIFIIQFREKDGGRTINLPISSKVILKSKNISSSKN